jgi:hypothetical protein
MSRRESNQVRDFVVEVISRRTSNPAAVPKTQNDLGCPRRAGAAIAGRQRIAGRGGIGILTGFAGFA